MPLGIKEDHKLEHVPGTAPLSELGHEAFNVSGIDSHLLKHDETGQIVLVPQPSDSPNDPLNWPRWKKEMFTISYAYGCGCVGAIGPLLAPAFVPLAEEFNVGLTPFISGVNGGLIAAIAFGSLIFNTLAVKYGKRPFYLLSTLGLLATCIWCAEAKGFVSLTAARVVQGFCMAPMEALVPASISDVWFVHQRGFRSAVFNLGVLGGINLAQPISGQVIQYGGYKTAFYAMAGAFAIQFILTFFFMPETAYVRHGAINIDTTTTDLAVEVKAVQARRNSTLAAGEKNEDVVVEAVTSPASSESSESKMSWAKELRPYSGYVNHVSFWNTLIRPFCMLASPVVLWATLLFTTCISWLVGIAVTLSQIFGAPPYNFSVGSVGACNLSSFVASVLGTLIAGPTVDGLIRFMAKRNGGTFEPEFRLPIMITYLAFTATGFFAWGQSVHVGEPWPIPVVVGLGMINFGIQLGTTGVVTYVADCHREMAGEAFAVMNFIKNMFAFGLSLYLNNWVVEKGVRSVFFTMAGITIGVSLCTIPMYIYGKQARSWTHRNNIAGLVAKHT